MWIVKNVYRNTWTDECFYHFQFSEIRDKYALAQKEISQLNTELQDATYELQKANHRVDNLVKRLNELEDMNKRLREGNTAPGEPGESEPVQVIMADTVFLSVLIQNLYVYRNSAFQIKGPFLKSCGNISGLQSHFSLQVICI